MLFECRPDFSTPFIQNTPAWSSMLCNWALQGFLYIFAFSKKPKAVSKRKWETNFVLKNLNLNWQTYFVLKFWHIKSLGNVTS